MVNAGMVAREMGIAVEEVRSTETDSFSNLITLTLEGSKGRRTIAGTLFEGIPKIVKMRNFDIDFRPEEHMLVMTYADRPGLIGRIGTILGAWLSSKPSDAFGRRKTLSLLAVLYFVSAIGSASKMKLSNLTPLGVSGLTLLPSASMQGTFLSAR